MTIHSYCAGSETDAGGEIVEISSDTHEVWLLQGSKEVFMEQVDVHSMFKGDLTKSYAHWWVYQATHLATCLAVVITVLLVTDNSCWDDIWITCIL